jgi:ribonuclease HI
MIEIYTDGSCNPNNKDLPNKGGCAYIFVKDGRIFDQDSYFTVNTSNNRMELMGVIRALKTAEVLKKEEFILYSDSKLLVNTYNTWMHNWVKKDWKNGKVKNLDLVKELYNLYFRCPHVKIQWVKGHDINKWNNYVDMLCNVSEK